VDYVNGLAAGPGGAVVVAEHGGGLERVAGDRVQPLLDALTTPVTGYGLPGTRQGFIDPTGVAVAADGTVYADTNDFGGWGDEVGLVEVSPTGLARTLPLTGTLAATLPAPGTPGFPAATYPPPRPASLGAGLSSCPSPQGLVPFDAAARSAASAEAVTCTTTFGATLTASDRALWPSAYADWTAGLGDLGRHDVDRVAPARDDRAAPDLALACGAALVAGSLVVVIGPSAYSRSASHLFFVDWGGRPLVYDQGQ